MDRRSFLKAIGLAPAALMVGEASAAKPVLEFMGRKILYCDSFQEPDTICYDFGNGRVMARKYSWEDGELRIKDVTDEEFFVEVHPHKKSDADAAKKFEKIVNHEAQKNMDAIWQKVHERLYGVSPEYTMAIDEKNRKSKP